MASVKACIRILYEISMRSSIPVPRLLYYVPVALPDGHKGPISIVVYLDD